MKKENKNINIDESFSFGPMEFMRSGKVISIRNNSDESQNDKFLNYFSNGYEEQIKEINELIYEVRRLISKCNPLKLLKYSYDNFVMSVFGTSSEFQFTREMIYKGRELEYIQSVIVSSENKYIKNQENVDELEIFELISSKIMNLYQSLELYSMYHTTHLIKNEENFDSDKAEFLMEAQSKMFVRGDRYAIYEIPHIRELLLAHNDEFIKLYNISVNDFIEGLSNIQKSLTKIENPLLNIIPNADERNFMVEIIELMGKYEEFEKEELKRNKNQTIDDIMKKFKKDMGSELKFPKQNNEAKYKKFDLEKLTNWPKNLLEDLSFKINENKHFYNNEYAGWPLIELPVFERPFINIDDKFYCFDYYNLFDNIYRVIQKTFRKKDKSYSDMWGIRQMETTENMVANLFKKVLPNCSVYTSNYYPVGKSLKQCNENDILVLYDDNLIIVEVKAGSYTYRSPMLDIKSHIQSLKTLVEKADGQAERTLKYLKSKEAVKLYNKDKSEKCEIKLSDFNEVTLMCITVDNFNEFCSKIEKFEFLSINKKTIALSIDDFRVYTDYFDSPLEFLHYLKQRKIATENKSLYLNDELDHLGMYIEHIFYSQVCESEDNRRVSAYGLREPLDNYFGSLLNKGFEIEKPKQKIPIELEKIIKFLGNSKIKNRVKLGTYILDFSPESKESLNNNISKALARQREINRMVQISLMGEAPMCVFCHQKNINNMSHNDIEKYTLAHMIKYDEKFRLELNIFYDTNNEITDIKFKFHEIENIPEEKVEELMEFGEELFGYRINNYKKQNNIKKIGRNDQCPCGSGKKYKKCHGK